MNHSRSCPDGVQGGQSSEWNPPGATTIGRLSVLRLACRRSRLEFFRWNRHRRLYNLFSARALVRWSHFFEIILWLNGLRQWIIEVVRIQAMKRGGVWLYEGAYFLVGGAKSGEL